MLPAQGHRYKFKRGTGNLGQNTIQHVKKYEDELIAPEMKKITRRIDGIEVQDAFSDREKLPLTQVNASNRNPPWKEELLGPDCVRPRFYPDYAKPASQYELDNRRFDTVYYVS